MNSQVKLKPDDTRARIMDTAETLFRRLGFAKTAVADIASELGMSPANVYRFFPSKIAIVQAICQRCLGELEDQGLGGRALARPGERSGWSGWCSKSSPITRKIFSTEQRVNDIVLVAMEESWDAIMAHKEVIRDGDRADPARRHRGRRIRAGRPARNLRADHARPGRLLPSDAARRGPAGRPRSRNRSARFDPLPAARHHPPKVIDHDRVAVRRFAPKD